jgi:hypothetical protein
VFDARRNSVPVMASEAMSITSAVVANSVTPRYSPTRMQKAIALRKCEVVPLSALHLA